MRRTRRFRLKELKCPIFEDPFTKEKKLGQVGSCQWLLEHDDMVDKFIIDSFHPDDHDITWSLFLDEPKMARLLVIDYFRENAEKIREIENLFKHNKSLIIMITGGRGSGKTACAFWVAERLRKDRQVYYCGEKIEGLPDWCHVVSDVAETPRGCLAIVDEGGIQAGARDFFTQRNQILSKQLMTLRHDNKTVIFLTQHSRLVEVNVTRLADCMLYKMQSSFQAITERKMSIKSYVVQLINNLMPRRKDETLFVMGNRIIKFIQDLPECWNDQISKSWQNIGQKLKKEAIEREQELLKHEKEKQKKSQKSRSNKHIKSEKYTFFA